MHKRPTYCLYGTGRQPGLVTQGFLFVGGGGGRPGGGEGTSQLPGSLFELMHATKVP
jgi:hypothetical protein